MESLTEQIAGEIGKKWVQLFTRLGLGDRARDRYQIVVEHKDDPKLCTRDTIRLWQKGLSTDLSEREMMTQLLAAFRTIKGFEDKAKQMAEDCGITLDRPASSTVPSHSEPPTMTTTCAAATPHTNSMSVALTITKSTPPHTSSPLTLHTERTPPGSTVDTNSEGSSDVESSSSSSKLPQPTQIRESPQQSLRSPKPAMHSHDLSTSTDHLRDHSQQLLNATIDISVTRHKYAILDICQRLPAHILSHFAQRLNVPVEKLRKISVDYSMIEERYYQVLKYWLNAGDSGRTFRELQSALEMCQQQAACDVIIRRLQSPGLTLRSPASSTRDT